MKPTTTFRVPRSPEERAPILELRRLVKMATSAHAYVRGAVDQFYTWSSSVQGAPRPRGPSIWIGGDCHVGNLGPLAHVDGSIQMQLRDLDQTVIGDPTHDLIRLALSMAMEVRASGLPGTVTARVVESIALGYQQGLEATASGSDGARASAPAALMKVLKAAGRRSRRDLLKERLGGDHAAIPIGDRFWPLTDAERSDVERFFASEEARGLITRLSERADDAPIKLIDAAYWVKGCSSLGLWRCAALVRVGGTEKKGERSLALIDIKEAPPPRAPGADPAQIPTHHGERVVAGARTLSPNLGNRMMAATIADRHVFVRELLPQDLKIDLGAVTEEQGTAVSSYLAYVIGLAHGAQMDTEQCAEWLTSLRGSSARGLLAPDWLWTSVVELVSLHESAYLEHCRLHAGARRASAPADELGAVQSDHAAPAPVAMP